MPSTTSVRCPNPECKEAIAIEDGELDQLYECESCYTEVVLVSVHPAEVQLVDEEK